MRQDQRSRNGRRGSRDSNHRGKGRSRGRRRHSSAKTPPPPENVELPGLPGEPKVIAREDHEISRSLIDEDALKVMARLNRYGHQAFLVGGAVRDLYLGKSPKDFDLGTDATPNRIRSIFRNSRTIGRRFKINHIYFRGGKIIEVTTFRSQKDESEGEDSGVNDSVEEVSEEFASVNESSSVELESPDNQEPEASLEASEASSDSDAGDDSKDGGEEASLLANEEILAKDNTFGDPETDAFRRDLTINGVFYNLHDKSLIDYVGGIEDLEKGIVRLIGDPRVRVQEDPVRMIRAVRHAARTGFEIEEKTWDAIKEFPSLLEHCPSARLHEELFKDLKSGASKKTFPLFKEAGLAPSFFGPLDNFTKDSPELWDRLLETLGKIDEAFLREDSPKKAPKSASIGASLLLGLVTDDFLSSRASFDSLEETETLVLKALFGSAPFSEGTPERGLIDELSRVKVSSEVVGVMREVLSDSLKPLGISRKDQEEIEKSLIVRLRLFELHAREEKRGKIPHIKSLPTALEVISLSPDSDWRDGCFERWENARRA